MGNCCINGIAIVIICIAIITICIAIVGIIKTKNGDYDPQHKEEDE